MAASSGGLKRLAADALDGPASMERSSVANLGSGREYSVVMKVAMSKASIPWR